MSRLVIPVTGKTLFATGDIKLWVEVDLLLVDRNSKVLSPEPFRVDSATEISTFPAYRAKQLDLAMPVRANTGVSHPQTGLEVRSGYLRFRVVGMDPTEYLVSVLFLGDPDTPLDPSQPGTFPRNLLQPLGLLEHLRFEMKKDPLHGSLYGDLIIEKA
jgi:hypothetical protein